MLRTGASLDDAFAALRREGLVDGELVRAERIIVVGSGGDGAAAAPGRRAVVLRKEEGPLPRPADGTLVLRLATNKRAPWQKQAQRNGAADTAAA